MKFSVRLVLLFYGNSTNYWHTILPYQRQISSGWEFSSLFTIISGNAFAEESAFFVRHTNQPLNGFRANTIAFSTETVSYSEHRFIFRLKKIGMSRRRLWKRAVAFLEGYFSQNSEEEKGTFETSCILIFWSMTNISNNLKGLLLSGKQDKINRKTLSENEAGVPTTAHDDRG